jgi:hypothetical protein
LVSISTTSSAPNLADPFPRSSQSIVIAGGWCKSVPITYPIRVLLGRGAQCINYCQAPDEQGLALLAAYACCM